MSTLTNLPVAATFHAKLFTDLDIYLFKQGKNFRLYDKLGSHPITVDGVKGTYFAVWAPNASAVAVIGDFNHWDATINALHLRNDELGIWDGFITAVTTGAIYKYRIVSRDGKIADKGDRLWAFSYQAGYRLDCGGRSRCLH